jgi:hypothetical protein
VLNFPAVDVAIGLVFVFFILSIVCSGINEAISSALRWRAQDLERGLWELLRDTDAKEDLEKAGAALEQLKAHPLVKPMLNPLNKASATPLPPMKNGRPKTSRKTDLPAYIPSRTFAAALLGIGQTVIVGAAEDSKGGMRKIEESIRKVPSRSVQEALTALLHNAQGNSVVFRRNVEQWYDDQMERVSGWYRRRIQKVLWILAFAMAIALNADSLQMAKRLWIEPSVRASLVSQAENASNSGKDTSGDLGSLQVPIGWHLKRMSDDPQGFPIGKDRDSIWALLSKLLGLGITGVAISFGAPFWFDTLSKLARLRNGGAPPPASDSIRRGEGEETRAGPGASLGGASSEPESVEGGDDTTKAMGTPETTETPAPTETSETPDASAATESPTTPEQPDPPPPDAPEPPPDK